MSPDDYQTTPSEIGWVDRAVWTQQRRTDTRRQLRRLKSSIARLESVRDARDPMGRVHLVVIPHDGPDTGLWLPASGNLTYEVYRSAVELLGEEQVTLAEIRCGEDDTVWQRYVLDLIAESQATHVFGQIERNPNKTTDWSWDVIAAALGRAWDGTMVGQMYDAGFQWLRLRTKRLASLMDNLLVADLCEPMVGYAVKGRPEVGPMTLPLSYETLAAIDRRIAGISKLYDVTFIGTLYDFRIAMLDRLKETGFDARVNPHRPDTTTTYEQSRTNQPSWLDYIAVLAQSELTVNFARASSGPRWQYKIRIQEAALAGCLCLTDDVDRTSRFFAPDQYVYFDSVESLEISVRERLSDRAALHAAQERARARARELAVIDYWGRIDDGLRLRGLPVITGLTAPRPPASTKS